MITLKQDVFTPDRPDLAGKTVGLEVTVRSASREFCEMHLWDWRFLIKVRHQLGNPY